jgi:hypothetical protein
MKTALQMKKKSPSYDQLQLKIISDKLCDNIQEVLETLGISEYRNFDKMVTMSCPIHGGDNESALNLYHQGDSYRGNWKCRTHQCEETFKSSIIGFIRGCLSHNQHNWSKAGDPTCSFSQALEFIKEFLNQEPSSIKISQKTREKISFVNTVKYINTNNQDNIAIIDKNIIKNNLNIPSKYFLDRGYSKEILLKYDVGECSKSGKEMSDRAVVPIYDNEYKYMVGCTGRSIYEKCNQCGYHHDDKVGCPDKDKAWLFSKWRHSTGFKTQEYLYNFWYAKKHIEKTKTVVLVESPGNVWRLEEAGIHNSLAMFGSSLGDRQKMLLDISGAMTIITIMDNDDAGRKASKQIIKKCEKTYNIKEIQIEYPDIGSMTVDQIQQDIVKLIEKAHK